MKKQVIRKSEDDQRRSLFDKWERIEEEYNKNFFSFPKKYEMLRLMDNNNETCNSNDNDVNMKDDDEEEEEEREEVMEIKEKMRDDDEKMEEEEEDDDDVVEYPKNYEYRFESVSRTIDGVNETEKKMYDSRLGEKTSKVRMVGDKKIQVETVKNKEGKEENRKIFENMEEKDEEMFEKDWEKIEFPKRDYDFDDLKSEDVFDKLKFTELNFPRSTFLSIC